ncbi:hypothetical protein, partial [Thiolapillus sp.]|uniref:hypothetical protein n=1 Tax=Thiolapillus sp. TaxID=2017437 RepID=UPI003AF8DD0C
RPRGYWSLPAFASLSMAGSGGLAATGVYQPSLRSPWLAAEAPNTHSNPDDHQKTPNKRPNRRPKP